MDGNDGPPAIYRQIKQNSEELLDYLRELKQWETEIKQVDAKLLQEKQKHSGESERDLLPPIRNSTDSISKSAKSGSLPEKQLSKPTKKAEKPKISSYDYASWEKFDVDQACEEVEESDEHDSETDSEAEMMMLKQEAEIEKEKGNEHLKANRLDEAIGCYTKGVALDPTNPLIPANRALAFIKKGQYAAAEEDCNVALRLDPRYAKGYLRRASARMDLQKYEEAKGDLFEVFKLEPNNVQAKRELAKIEKLKQELAKVHSSAAVVRTSTVERKDRPIDSLIVTPIDKPVHLRSKKPLHRIKVVEVLEDDKHPLVSLKQETSTDERKTVMKMVQSRNTTISNETPSLKTPIPSVPDVNVSNLTSYQFHKDFRRLKSHPELLFEYIKKIPASKYPQLFQHSLESDVMSQLLIIYRDFYLPNGLDIHPFLLHLSNIKRFSALRMFLSEDDKKVLCDLFLDLKKKEMIPEDFDFLSKAYEIQT